MKIASNVPWNTQAFVAGFLLVASILIFAPGSSAPFISTGESREALVAQSMLIHGDLLQSVRYDHELATKPPLLHWLMVASSKVTGEMNEIAARMPSIVAAAIVMIAWTLLLIPLIGISRALLAFSILLTSAEWYRHAAHARVDMLLAACISGALIALFYWAKEPRVKLLSIAGVLMALAALTKGPVGIALPLMITVTALLWWRELTRNKVIQLAAVGALAALPLFTWYLAEQWVTQGNLIDIVLHENLDRLFGKMSKGSDPHTHGPLYLFGAFFTGLLPWSLFALAAIPYYWKHGRNALERDRQQRIFQWCSISVLVCFTFFHIPSSKRGVYLLPIYPPAATLLSIVLYELATKWKRVSNRLVIIAAGLLSFLWLTILLVRFGIIDIALFASSAGKLEKLEFYTSFFAIPSNVSLMMRLEHVLPFIIVFVALFTFRNKPVTAYMRFAAILAFFFVFAKINFILPLTHKLSSKSFIATELAEHNPPELTMQTIRMYSEVFYARQLRPDIAVKDFDENSKYVLVWEDRETEIKKPAYIHKSLYDVEKPGRHLEFAILDEFPGEK